MINQLTIDNNIAQKISESDSFTIERYQQFVKRFRKEDKSILDFGCNTGRGGEVIKKFNSELYLYGADIVEERLLKANDQIYYKKINLLTNKIEDIIKKLDIVVSGEVVEHIEFKLLIDYLQSFKKLLNPNGLLIITTPNPDSFLVRIGRNGVLNDPSHINIMGVHFLKSILIKIGFKKITIKGSGKMTRYIGENFPINFYGSYLVIAEV